MKDFISKILIAFTILMILAACNRSMGLSSGGGGPVGPPGPSGPPDVSVTYNGKKFIATTGPIRAEILDESRLTATGLFVYNYAVWDTDNGSGLPIYSISGIDPSEAFLVKSEDSQHAHNIGAAQYSVPACPSGTQALVFATNDAPSLPPPFGRSIPTTPTVGPTQLALTATIALNAIPPPTPRPSTPEPGTTPTPTAAPTQAPLPPVEVELSESGLLSARWPQFQLLRAKVIYKGKAYYRINEVYIGKSSSDAISKSSVDTLETISVSYLPNIQSFPLPALNTLVSNREVTDTLMVYRLRDYPSDQILVLDPCSSGLHPAEYVLYQPVKN